MIATGSSAELPPLLDDDAVRRLLTPSIALEAASRALVDAYRGDLHAPPRMHASIGEVLLSFTAGGYEHDIVGFRVYGTWAPESDQAVICWDRRGRLRGIVVGFELGARRTGALGAAAASALARADADVVAVIGSGTQAWTQLWALRAATPATQVRVFSPTQRHREEFARRAIAELGVEGRAVSSAEAAVADAAIVILATRSEQPVIEAEWIAAGTHVATIGPKTASAHETPPALAERASVVVSDSPAQAQAYEERFFTDRSLTHLGAVLAGEAAGRRTAADVTLYCSTGVAGSEVVIADALLRRVDAAKSYDDDR